MVYGKTQNEGNLMSSKNYFIKGPIEPSFIAEQIASHSIKTDIGGHAIFLGQVRADEKEGKVVDRIDYSAYTEMANEAIFNIRQEAFSGRDLRCLHVYHSIGEVKAGEISLFIFVSSAHRKEAIEGMQEIVEKIKYRVPIWKKEIMTDKSADWLE